MTKFENSVAESPGVKAPVVQVSKASGYWRRQLELEGRAAQMNMVIEFSATVDGDKMTGEAEFGSFGKATLEGTRA